MLSYQEFKEMYAGAGPRKLVTSFNERRWGFGKIFRIQLPTSIDWSLIGTESPCQSDGIFAMAQACQYQRILNLLILFET